MTQLLLDFTPTVRPKRWATGDQARALIALHARRGHADHIRDLRCENAQLRGDLAAAYCRMDDMEGLNDE